MKNYICLIACLFIVSNAAIAENKKHSFMPSHGYVPNEITAIKIAEAVWLPIYGNDIYSKKPFKAKLIGDNWVVVGSLPKNFVGGVPLIEISKKSGKVIRVSHGK